jgi:pyruvate-formate lyase-activating enzyme
MTDSRTTVRTFDTICDVCLRDLDTGALVQDGDKIYFTRTCPEHGKRSLLFSQNGDDYVRFDRAYHSVFHKGEPPAPVQNAYFILTGTCNQGCSYCLMESNNGGFYNKYDLRRFETDLMRWKGDRVSLLGGEPLCHPQFFDFAEATFRYGKKLILMTNGLVLSDGAAVRRLVDIARGRPWEVQMTFEGFSPALWGHLRAKNARERKLDALANLEKYGVATTLHVTFPPGSFETNLRRSAIREVIQYAMEHDFVHNIGFQSASALGGARDAALDQLAPTDRVMDMVVESSPVPMVRRHVYTTQKLIFLMTGLMQQPWCEHTHMAMLFRAGQEWLTLDQLLDCDALDRRLDRYFTGRPVARAQMLRALAVDVIACVRPRRALTLALLAAGMVPSLYKEFDRSKVPRTLLPIGASMLCDRYNLDRSVQRRCDKMSHSAEYGTVVVESCCEFVIRDLRRRVAEEQGAVERGTHRLPVVG